MVPSPADCPRVERESAAQRRQQVLDAAADCFRRNGFHNAGMAQIAREAGMSVGHIYHYFDSKEAIIAAFVERDQAHILERIEGMRCEDDIVKAMIERIPVGVDEHVGGIDSALQLEILAESSRNPDVALLVRSRDETSRRMLGDTITNGRHQRNLPPLSEAELDARVEVIVALFGGLTCRGIVHPELDREQVSTVVGKVMHLLTAG